MAAFAKLRSSWHAALQLKPVLAYGDYTTARLVTQHTTAATTSDNPGITFTRKQDLTFAPDDTDIERIIRVLSDFAEACTDELLMIHNMDCHKKAREVLGGDLKVIWDNTITASTNTLDADFSTNVCAFLSNFSPSNSFLIQQEYLQGASKPFHITCFNVAFSLRLINSMSIYHPGSGGSKLLVEPKAIKNVF